MKKERIAYLLWNSIAGFSRSANAYQKIRLAVENLNATIVVPIGCRSYIPEDFRDRSRILELAFPRLFLCGRMGKVFGGLFCTYASIVLRRKFDKYLINAGNEFAFFWIRLVESWARVVLFCWDPPGVAVRNGKSLVARLRCALIDWMFSIVSRRSAVVILNLHRGFLERFNEDVRNKIRDFPNGTNVAINRAAATGVEHVAKRIAVSAFFGVEKGCWDVANLFVDIWERDPEASLIWIGSGPEKSAVESLFMRKGIPSSSYTLRSGSHDYAMRQLASASVALNAYRDVESLRWNYVLKAPEFLSLGLPIVTVRVPGVAFYINEGQTGAYFNSGDWVGASKAIRELFADQERIRKMQERAVEASMQFDWIDINRQIVHVILHVE